MTALRDDVLLTWLCAWRLNRRSKLVFGMPVEVIRELSHRGWVIRRRMKSAKDGSLIWNTSITMEGETQADLFGPEAGVVQEWTSVGD